MMKKLLLSLVLFLLAGQITAQQEGMIRAKRTDSRVLATMPSPISRETLNKTNGIPGADSLYDLLYSYLDLQCSSNNFNYYRVGTLYDALGFYYGSDPNDLSKNIVFGEWGTEFNIATNNGQAPWIDGAYVYFDSQAGTMNSQVGAADTFRFNLYNVSTTFVPSAPQNSPITATARFSRKFTINDLKDAQVVNNEWIPSENGWNDNGNWLSFPGGRVQASGDVLFTIQTTSRTGSSYGDDSLTLTVPKDRDACDPDSMNEMYVRLYRKSDFVASGSGFGWKLFRFWYPASTQTDLTAKDFTSPLIIPILYYPYASRDTQLGKSAGLTLYSNYPNPVVEGTTIRYEMANAGTARIRIFDTQGRVVRSYENPTAIKGMNQVYVDTQELSCGYYTYLIETSQGNLGAKFQVVK